MYTSQCVSAALNLVLFKPCVVVVYPGFCFCGDIWSYFLFRIQLVFSFTQNFLFCPQDLGSGQFFFLFFWHNHMAPSSYERAQVCDF